MVVYVAVVNLVLWNLSEDFTLLFVDASETEVIANAVLFLHVSASFFPFLGMLCILRYSIQGAGYTQLSMLSGVAEMIARILVSVWAVPLWGYWPFVSVTQQPGFLPWCSWYLPFIMYTSVCTVL